MQKPSDHAIERFSSHKMSGDSEIWMLNHPDFTVFKRYPGVFLYDRPTMQLDESILVEAIRIVSDGCEDPRIIICTTSQTASHLNKIRGMKHVEARIISNDEMLWGLESGFAHPFELDASPFEWIKVVCQKGNHHKTVSICFLKRERPLPHQVW